jgi:hypothetical protein
MANTGTFFFVIAETDNSISWSVKNEMGERFTSRTQANRRAREMASDEPGTVFFICKSVAAARCTVQPAELTDIA